MDVEPLWSWRGTLRAERKTGTTMDAKIALAAPGRLLTLDAFEEARIRKFIDDNIDR